MKTRKELLYAKTHEWVLFESDGSAKIGITDYAQENLGDLVYVNLPLIGDSFTVDESFADVESVKAVSDVLCPVAGVVCDVNEELIDAPEKINENCYEAWLVKINEISEKTELMTSEEYEEFIKNEG